MDTSYYDKQVLKRYGPTKIARSEYYRNPEGQDLFGKLRYTTKWATFISGFLGLAEAINSPSPSYKEYCFRFLRPVIPAVGMATAFTLTVYHATNLRKKDDEINYCLGGIAAGTVFGMAMRSVHFGILGSVVLGLCASQFKGAGDEGFYKKVYQRGMTPYERRALDWSLVPYEEGNWTKENPKNKL